MMRRQPCRRRRWPASNTTGWCPTCKAGEHLELSVNMARAVHPHRPGGTGGHDRGNPRLGTERPGRDGGRASGFLARRHRPHRQCRRRGVSHGGDPHSQSAGPAPPPDHSRGAVDRRRRRTAGTKAVVPNILARLSRSRARVPSAGPRQGQRAGPPRGGRRVLTPAISILPAERARR